MLQRRLRFKKNSLVVAVVEFVNDYALRKETPMADVLCSSSLSTCFYLAGAHLRKQVQTNRTHVALNSSNFGIVVWRAWRLL